MTRRHLLIYFDSRYDEYNVRNTVITKFDENDDSRKIRLLFPVKNNTTNNKAVDLRTLLCEFTRDTAK